MEFSKYLLSHCGETYITLIRHSLSISVQLQSVKNSMLNSLPCSLKHTAQKLIFFILGLPLPSAASTVSTKSVSTPGSLQRSRSDVDVNAAASAKSKVTSSGASNPFSSAAALPPGSYASLGKAICSTVAVNFLY